MTRRGLLATVLGALAGSQFLTFISPASQVVKSASPSTWSSGRPRTGVWSGEYEVLGEVEIPISHPVPPVVSIGSVIISSEAEADAFLKQIVAAIQTSARRLA